MIVDVHNPKFDNPTVNATLSHINNYRYKGDLKTYQVIENAAYDLIEAVLKTGELPEHLQNSWSVRYDEKGYPVLVVQNSFEEANPGFVDTFFEARIRSKSRFQETVNTFVQEGFSELSGLEEVFMPIVCMDVTDADSLAEEFGDENFLEYLKENLEETAYWKASSNLVLSHKTDSGHDFPSYAMSKAEELNMDTPEFLTLQTAHENNHLIIESTITKAFRVDVGWLHEGAAEFYTGMEGRGRGHIDVLRQSLGNISVDQVMNHDIKDPLGQKFRYGGGWLLFRSIAFAYDSNDPIKGSVRFLRDLVDHPLKKEGDVNGAVLGVLERKDLLEVVKTNFQAGFS